MWLYRLSGSLQHLNQLIYWLSLSDGMNYHKDVMSLFLTLSDGPRQKQGWSMVCFILFMGIITFTPSPPITYQLSSSRWGVLQNFLYLDDWMCLLAFKIWTSPIPIIVPIYHPSILSSIYEFRTETLFHCNWMLFCFACLSRKDT